MYRASSLGACTKRLIAERLGYQLLEPPPAMADVFAAGNAAEEDAIAHLREHGARVWGEQDLVTLHVSDRVVVDGHVDGFIAGDGFEDSVLEIKSMGRAEFDRFMQWRWTTPGIVQRYKWQISAYMIATKLPAYVYIVCRGDEPLSYVSLVNKPFYSLEDIRMRVFQIESVARTGELPIACDNRIFPCPVYYLHEDEPEREDDDGPVEALAGSYIAAKDNYDAAKRTYDEVRGRLKGLLGDRRSVGTRSIKVTQYSTTRTSYDTKRAIEDGIDLEPYKRTSSTPMLKVTVRNAAKPAGTEPRTDTPDGTVERG